jgi:hypothetical protein
VAWAGSVWSLVRTLQNPPVLQVREAVFDGSEGCGAGLVGVLLSGGEPAVAGGLEAGDDDGTARIVVQTDEAEAGQCSKPSVAHVGNDLVAAGGDVVSASGSSN